MGYLPTSKYHIWYDSIIRQAKNRITESYTETHHIIPKSFFVASNSTGWLPGNPDERTNLVELLPKEHYLCHKLLVKMTTGVARQKMVSALWRMANSRRQTVSIPARVYATIRELAIQNLKITASKIWCNTDYKNAQMVRLSSADRKAHLSKKMKEVRNTPEAKQKQSEINKQIWSDPEYKAKRSKINAEVNKRPDKREAQSKANKVLWTPERRAAWSERMKLVRQRPELRERQRQITTERNAQRRSK